MKTWRTIFVPILSLRNKCHKRRAGRVTGLTRADGDHLALQALDEQRGKEIPGSLDHLLLGVEKVGRLHELAPFQA